MRKMRQWTVGVQWLPSGLAEESWDSNGGSDPREREGIKI